MKTKRSFLACMLFMLGVACGIGLGAQGGSTTLPSFKRPDQKNPVRLEIPSP